jgi:hypothetical protein
MTDFHEPPANDDDEMLSAYLDGEATPEEAARVASEPRLQARLRELEAAAALVGIPVEPAPATALEAAIGAALAAADAPTAPVIQLDSRRRKQWALASVAAVVLLVVIAAARVLQPSDTASTTALNQAESKAVTSTLGAPAAAEQAPAADRATDAAASYVGAFATPSALVSGTRALLDARLAAATSTGAAGATTATGAPFAALADCSPADPDRGAVVFDGTATLGGQPVRVLVQRDSAGTRLLSILDEQCRLLVAQEL